MTYPFITKRVLRVSPRGEVWGRAEHSNEVTQSAIIAEARTLKMPLEKGPQAPLNPQSQLKNPLDTLRRAGFSEVI